MAYENLPESKPAPLRIKNAPVFCVGWNAFVNWPSSLGQGRPVPLTDSTGKPIPNDLADGQQVEILSWRPPAREGVMYQVRRKADASEWWIEARYLRRQVRATIPPPKVV